MVLSHFDILLVGFGEDIIHLAKLLNQNLVFPVRWQIDLIR